MSVPTSLKAANPADRAFVITPDDDNDIDDLPARGIYVGGAGSASLATQFIEGGGGEGSVAARVVQGLGLRIRIGL